MNAEQLFTRLPSPVSGQLPALAIVNRPRSIVADPAHSSTPPTFNFQSSTFNQPHLFLKQLTWKNPAITRNSPRIQPSKSQESDLFLEKVFLIFFQ
jgi:hypothetical protein